MLQRQTSSVKTFHLEKKDGWSYAVSERHLRALPVPATPAATGLAAANLTLTAVEEALSSKLLGKVQGADHACLMDTILGRSKKPIRSIVIFVYDSVKALDSTRPRYVLGQAGARTQLIGVSPGRSERL